MQDIHLIGGGGGRFFIGNGGGDHRIRAHQHQAAAAKCPRCDSVNTKFCYYNNYNLSQPRHFCKCCRRYWTKGGVLRNVPIGGGCRKSKRPSSKRNSPSVDQEEEDETAKSSEKRPIISETAAVTNNSCSSDSSSISASAFEIASEHSPAVVSDLVKGVLDSVSLSASAAKPVTEHPKLYGTYVSASTSFSTSINGSSNSNPYGNGDGVEWTAVIDGLGSTSSGGFLPEIGSLTNLIPTPSAETTAFGYEGRIVNHLQAQQESQGGSIYDHFFGRSSFSGIGGFEPLDWTSGNDDQGLFDLPRTVDQTYLSQNQWSRDDGQHSLFP